MFGKFRYSLGTFRYSLGTISVHFGTVSVHFRKVPEEYGGELGLYVFFPTYLSDTPFSVPPL